MPEPFRFRDAALRAALKDGTLHRIDIVRDGAVEYAWCPEETSARYMEARLKQTYPTATITTARVDTLDVE